MKKLIYFLPRILSILITGFFGIFIFEGFGPDFTWRDSLMHFLITAVVAGISFISWKRPKIGGWLFIAFGAWWLFILNWRLSSAIVSGVQIITGILFLIEGYSIKQQKNEK